jgi:thiamine biosynthesis lipoprotein
MTEARKSFACFGATCNVLVSGPGAAGVAAAARELLLSWHARFTRFDPGSELSRLNADRRACIPVTPLMGRLAAAVADAAELTGGLVDATLLDEIEAAGYGADLGDPLDLTAALALAPPRRPAGPRADGRHVAVDLHALLVRRPRGLRIDGGGLAKGLFADVVAETLGDRTFAIDCAGDVRVGGEPRAVHVESPFDGTVLRTVAVHSGGIATSGIGRCSWLDDSGAPAHHLLDPATGRPAFTGVVQATALAPTALEAEIRSKAAVLSGPDGAADWLPHGGVVVLDDGAVAGVNDAAGARVSARRPRSR